MRCSGPFPSRHRVPPRQGLDRKSQRRDVSALFAGDWARVEERDKEHKAYQEQHWKARVERWAKSGELPWDLPWLSDDPDGPSIRKFLHKFAVRCSGRGVPKGKRRSPEHKAIIR